MENEAQLGSLEASIGSAVGQAFGAALEIDIPGGMTQKWQEILAAYDVKPLEDEERQSVAKATEMLRGAPVDELYRVLTCIQKQAMDAVQAIEYPDDNALARRWERLRSAVDAMRDDTVKAYRKRVLPRRGMLSHALAAAQKGGNASRVSTGSPAFVQSCSNCGAPRLNLHSFECDFCQTAFGG